jgi:hypothetical protein
VVVTEVVGLRRPLSEVVLEQGPPRGPDVEVGGVPVAVRLADDALVDTRELLSP